MLDHLTTLLAAKAKAVGLVAGTALVTTALVGGGTVALSAVSNDSALQTAVTASPTPGAESALKTAAVSATPTVGIAPSPLPGQVDADGDRLDDRTLLPLGFACDDSKNHGQNVSSYVHTLPKGPGRGALVSAVAKSDCGKKAKAEASASPEAQATESPKAKPTKAAKPAKPAKAQKPAKQKPAKAQKPAKSKDGKGGGKD